MQLGFVKRTPFRSTIGSASSSTLSPSSPCPMLPYASASRARKYGHNSSAPWLVGSQALEYLHNALRSLSLRPRPSPTESFPRLPVRQPLLRCEACGDLCLRLGRVPLPAELMQRRSQEVSAYVWLKG